MMNTINNISQFLSHPVVLLFIGAFISGLLIPYFTNRWQNYQKELEVKTDLVGRINESVMRLVMSVQFVEVILGHAIARNGGVKIRQEQLQNELEQINKNEELLKKEHGKESEKKKLDQKKRSISKELEDMNKIIQDINTDFTKANDEYRQWEISSAVIGSQITSYFPETKRKGKLTWSDFSNNVTRLYTLIEPDCSCAFYGTPIDREDWGKMKENVLKQKDDIVRYILESSISGFSDDLFRRFIRRFIPKHKEENA